MGFHQGRGAPTWCSTGTGSPQGWSPAHSPPSRPREPSPRRPRASLGLKKGTPVVLPRGGPAEQRLLPRGAGPRRGGGNGRHLRGRVRDRRIAVELRPASRVNTFVHVNHTPREPALRRSHVRERDGDPLQLGPTPPGGRLRGGALRGAEQGGRAGPRGLRRAVGPARTETARSGHWRTATRGASVLGLDFNRHGIPHLLRAAQEGIVFALNYGLRIMKAMGLEAKTVRAGHANMFLSPAFPRDVRHGDGRPRGAVRDRRRAGRRARAPGVGAGLYASPRQAFVGLTRGADRRARPLQDASACAEAYGRWERRCTKELG